MCKKLICLILFTLVLGIAEAQAADVSWERAAYWDGRYWTNWADEATTVRVRDGLAAASYTVLNADQLKTWMDARIADNKLSVVVFCRDIAPDTVIESMSATCTLRKYLDAGGKIVFYADIPFYNQGHSDGSVTNWAEAGANNILGIGNVTVWDPFAVTFTSDGIKWGLTQTWTSQRPYSASTAGFTTLAVNQYGDATAWVKHFVAGDTYRGFVRLWDTGGGPPVEDIIRVAEYVEYFAANPSPADGGIVPETATYLTWTPGYTAVTHEGFLSSNLADVNDRKPSASLGPVTDPFYYVSGLTRGTTYYWCIDEKDAGSNVYKGVIWSFTVQPLKAWSPTPTNGQGLVSLTPTLSWNMGAGAIGSLLYLGTSSTNLKFQTPVINHVVGQLRYSRAITTALAYNTTYYWRVDQRPSVGAVVTGDIWSFTTVPNIPITDPTLLGWWKLDEGSGTTTALDWSGHNNHGTLIGGPTYVAGVFDKALNLDGSNDYVDIVNPTSLPSGNSARSMCGWAKTDSTAGGYRWIAAYGSSTNTQAMFIGMNGNVLYGGGYGDDITVNDFWNVGVWHHICLTYDGTTARLYADGIEVASQAKSWNLVLNRAHIGRQVNDAAEFWDGAIDDVRIYNRVLSGDEIKKLATPPFASNPDPPDNTDGVALSYTLGWTAGAYAVSHDVYIGTGYGDVNTATTSSHPNVQYFNRSVPNCPIGPLNSATVYYWRVDEVNNAPPNNGLQRGKIWVFRTVGGTSGLLGAYYNWPGVAYGPPPNPPVAAFQELRMTRIDPQVNFTTTTWPDAGSPDLLAAGINPEHFSVKWMGSVNAPVSGSYTFYTTTDDGVMLWVNNQLIITSWIGQSPTEYGGTITLTAGWHDIEMWYFESGGGNMAELRWQGPIMTRQIIPAWYLSPPLKASVPQPNDGEPEAPPTAILGWRPGDKAAKLAAHDVYFGTDFNDVNEATTLSPPSIYRGRRDPNTYDPPETLEMNQTYYWRVDEVNGANIWRGNVWSFTVANYLVVEDYERYNNTSDIIWQTWTAGGGGKAGYPDPNCAELTIIHGGRQSMPFDYSNILNSEASRTFTTTQKDWTAYGVEVLSLWLRGYPVTFGSFVENPVGTYTMTARGTDIESVPDLRRPSRFHDEFHYAYWQVTGDYAISAKVESMTNTDGWAKAGVMIRDSIDANSAHAMTCLTPSATNGVAFQHRAVAGGVSIADFNFPNINPPNWVAVKRQGTTFTGFYSIDGVNFTTLYSTTLTMTEPVCIGLSLTAHNTAATCTAVFSDVKLYTVDAVGEVTPVTPLPPWTSHQDIGIKSNVAGPLYVTLQDSGARTATITHDDPNIALATSWSVWGIPLVRFTSLNPALDLTKIQKLTVGVGSRGTGTIYVDDIRLYAPMCISGLPGPQADFNGDCVVNYADLAVLTNNWLVREYQVTPVAPPVSDPNLELWYQFENNLLDSSGKGRNGDPCGAPGYAGGKIGQALSVNGGDSVDTHVIASAMKIGGNRPKTVTAWVYTRDFNDGGIFDVGDNVNGQNFSLRTLATDNLWRAQRWGWPAYDFDFVYSSLNTWVHMALVYYGSDDNGNEIDDGDFPPFGNESRVYADGICVGTQTVALNTTNTRTFQIALWNGIYLNGLIDDLRVYSRALSQREIAYLAGKTASFTQPLKPFLMPQNTTTLQGPPVNMYDDSVVDFRDYAVLAGMWLEELLWPPPMMNVWGYEFKNDANCYNVGDPPKEARDLHLQFADVIYLVDTGPFTTFAGNETSKITLSGGTVPANGSVKIRVGNNSTTIPTLNKWWWTDEQGNRIGKEMSGVGPSCKKIT